MKIVFFAGGPGTRFWPISRKKMPKQLIPMFDGKSTMRMHLENMFPKYGWNNILITTTDLLATKIKEEFPDLPLMNLITEPVRRDLGPAVGLTMMKLHKMGAGKEPVAILWTDNFIGKPENFFASMRAGEQFILQDSEKIIFIGEKPQYPNENLGWIEIGEEIESIEGQKLYKREAFTYRPEKQLAEAWTKDNKHLWNTGYFITTADFILSEYEKQDKKLYALLVQIGEAMHTSKENEVIQELYPHMESVSFDNVVLEGVDPEKTLVLAGDFGWSDPGTLYALKQFLQKNEKDNVEKGQVFAYKSEDCLLYNYNEKQLLTTIGLDGFVVVNTKDAILVTHKDNVRHIGDMLKELEKSGLSNFL